MNYTIRVYTKIVDIFLFKKICMQFAAVNVAHWAADDSAKVRGYHIIITYSMIGSLSMEHNPQHMSGADSSMKS
jgi:hypothetical protein